MKNVENTPKAQENQQNLIKNNEDIIYLEIEGSHYDMGVQQGAQTKELYDRFFEELVHSELITDAKPKFIPTGLVLRLLGWFSKRKLRPVLKKYSPKQNDFILGLGKGLQISKNFTYGLNLLEILTGHPTLTMTWPKGVHACTQILATSEATTNGIDYFARNYDFPNVLVDYQMVRVVKPDEGYKNIGLTQNVLAGVHQGMNEKGLAVGINYGYSWKKKVNGLPDYRIGGLPSTILVQETLENCATMEESINFITNYPMRGNGAHYGILDKEGNACIVETTSSRHAIRYPKDGVLAHANLYLTEELLDANLPESVTWDIKHLPRPIYLSPKRRYERAHELLHKKKGKLNREEIYKILSDHNGREPDDDTVCMHGDVSSSLATITCVPKKMEFWVHVGLPCTGTQKMFKLE